MKFILEVSQARPGDERIIRLDLGIDGASTVETAVTQFRIALMMVSNGILPENAKADAEAKFAQTIERRYVNG